MEISAERLTYWYFRLNGFFGNDNFIIHRELNQADHATEIDYLGVRFIHRKELYDNHSSDYMNDDFDSSLFKYYPKDKIYISIVEVKRGVPKLNFDSKTDENKLKQLLLSLGCINFKYIPKVTRQLLKNGHCIFHGYYFTFVAIGRLNQSRFIQYEKIPIISWNEIIKFIYKRFTDYRREKSNLKEWSEFAEAREFGNLAKSCESFEIFYDNIQIVN